MFKLISKYKPTGDQPQAIEKLVNGIKKGYKEQTLLGVTGSGKTFTIANIIEQVQKPTIIMIIIKLLQDNYIVNLKSYFQTMQLNTLFHIMTTINLKRTLPLLIHILKKIVV